eukprot:s107_g35.t2
MPFAADPKLLDVEKHPQLAPYRSLDASRLKLVGEGAWAMEEYLDGPLWLPFQEPSFLLHGLPVSDDCLPNFDAEDPKECFRLAKVWDQRGLSSLHPEPIAPGMFSRVFNAFKDPLKDRQIGDRRAVNMAEYHIDGPSKRLPQGPQLTCIRVPRFTHWILGSVTDRRDFYHQARVTKERSQSNMLPFSFPLLDFQGTRAFDAFHAALKNSRPEARETVGDHLGSVKPQGQKRKKSPVVPDQVFFCFSSLFQGDHLGVEFALRSHSLLLENHGLLDSVTRVQGGLPVPSGPDWDALVIDDYFCLGACPISSPKERSFAMRSLGTARKAYEDEGLIGSVEKDIAASPFLKAAGAEIRSSEKNARAGVVPVGAPLEKRISLAVLSLRAAVLPGTTASLISRLAGNWVSVLQYRKCFASLVDSLFKLSSACLEEDSVTVHFLPRDVAQELTMLAACAPLIFSNIAVDYLGEIYSTDASNQKGAVVSSGVSVRTQEAVWLVADKQGAYTHLDNGFRAVLRQLGELDEDLDIPGPSFSEPISKQPLMYFDFVEICGGAGKVTAALHHLGHSVAPVLDLSNSRHYDLCSLRLLEWICYMIEENRFRSFLIAPPCTTFSPAAHPAVRSYKEPLGFDRKNPKTLLGNVLAFRTLFLLRIGRRHKRPCGAEQSRLSKMCWLELWKSLQLLGFSEAVVASCVFGSPHKKEFRLIVFMLEADFLDRRCQGGHTHVRVQGALTKPSAVYVDGLAHHIGLAYHRALLGLDAAERLEKPSQGLESVLVNDVALSSKWAVVRSWFWKRPAHINVLELASSVSSLATVAQKRFSVRFSTLVDSAVCRGALAKGRSVSFSLQPGLKRAAAWCIGFDLYPAWPYVPTRLNVADDPTRGSDPRAPVASSIVATVGLDVAKFAGSALRRFAANWARLCLLMLSSCPVTALPCLTNLDLHPVQSSFLSSLRIFGFVGGLCPLLDSFSLRRFEILPGLSPLDFLAWAVVSTFGAFLLVGLLQCVGVSVVGRKTYLEWFRKWLWEERQVSFRALIDQRPPDPERISDLLVDYGKAMYRSGKAYGIYAETINSVCC